MNILSIVEVAYRGTLEEQDDPILWLNHALRNSGAELSVLLRGNAVNYLVRMQDASGLSIGDVALVHPAVPDRDLERLAAAGVPLFAVAEDMQERGVTTTRMIESVTPVKRAELPELLDRFDYVWHW